MPILDWHVFLGRNSETGLPLWSPNEVVFFFFSVRKRWGGKSHERLKLKNSPSMKFPFVFPRCTPFSKISAVSTIHLVPGKDKCFCSPSTSSLPPHIKKNRRWKLIASFPSPGDSDLLFAVCWEWQMNRMTQDESLWSPLLAPAPWGGGTLPNPSRGTIQAPLWPSWAAAPGWGSEFDILVLMNISVAHLSWSVSSNGISCIYQCHTHRRF